MIPDQRLENPLNQQAEAVKQLASRLFASFSHDIATPASALRGYVKMVLDGRAGPLTDVQREYLSIALENADLFFSLANRMSKIPDLMLQIQAERFDLRAEWTEASNERRSWLVEKAMTVTERSLTDPLVVLGDRKQLRQVFQRMMDLAIQSGNPGNELVGEFFRGVDRTINVRICLSGDGIPSTADLSAVHNIILLHGGRFSMEKQSRNGSACIINLPEAA